MAQKPTFTNVLQVGMVVKDCYATMKTYSDKYGIGPWVVYDFTPDKVQDMQVRGKPQKYAMRLAMATVGNVELELIEPLDDKSDYAKFLKEKGEGVHHLGVEVEDPEQAVELFQAKGVGVLQAGRWYGSSYTYFETQPDLATIIETFTIPPDFERPEPDDVYPKGAELQGASGPVAGSGKSKPQD